MPTLNAFLTYEQKADEAVRHYLAVFEQGKILDEMRAPGPDGKPMIVSVTFELFGQRVIALNGGPSFSFSSGFSFFVSCDTQEEIDRYWDGLTREGKEVQCGWLVDKYGVSWQIVPKILGELLGHADREKAGRALQAMLGMKKLDIAGLRKAFDGV